MSEITLIRSRSSVVLPQPGGEIISVDAGVPSRAKFVAFSSSVSAIP
ncbi:MAG: hypothetical protein LBN43_02450 [Oscillospiraceae bacterium]|nr:hypothetical protein [Oscillospiraceae bacterium]